MSGDKIQNISISKSNCACMIITTIMIWVFLPMSTIYFFMYSDDKPLDDPVTLVIWMGTLAMAVFFTIALLCTTYRLNCKNRCCWGKYEVIP